MKLDLAPTVLVPEKRDKKEEVQIKQDHNKKTIALYGRLTTKQYFLRP